MTRLELRICGRVQGVGFRYHTAEAARRIGVSGWVRNTEQGDVESVAEGSQEQLDEFLAWCRQGPPAARVVQVHTASGPATGEFTGFGIRR